MGCGPSSTDLGDASRTIVDEGGGVDHGIETLFRQESGRGSEREQGGPRDGAGAVMKGEGVDVFGCLRDPDLHDEATAAIAEVWVEKVCEELQLEVHMLQARLKVEQKSCQQAVQRLCDFERDTMGAPATSFLCAITGDMSIQANGPQLLSIDKFNAEWSRLSEAEQRLVAQKTRLIRMRSYRFPGHGEASDVADSARSEDEGREGGGYARSEGDGRGQESFARPGDDRRVREDYARSEDVGRDGSVSEGDTAHVLEGARCQHEDVPPMPPPPEPQPEQTESGSDRRLDYARAEGVSGVRADRPAGLPDRTTRELIAQDILAVTRRAQEAAADDQVRGVRPTSLDAATSRGSFARERGPPGPPRASLGGALRPR